MKIKIISISVILFALYTQLYPSYSSSVDIKTITAEAVEQARAAKTALIEAVLNADVKAVKDLLAQNVDVNQADAQGDTALNHAVTHATEDEASQEIIQLLLNTPNIDLTKENKDGFTALALAIDNNNADIVKLILTRAQELTKKDPELLEKLFNARIIRNKKQFFKDLELQAEKSPKLKDDLEFIRHRYGDTVMLRAVKLGNEEIIKLLIDNGASIADAILVLTKNNEAYDETMGEFNILSIQDLLAKVPEDALPILRKEIAKQETLISSAEKNNIDKVKELLGQGITPNAQDGKGNTPLSYALVVRIAQLLIYAGAKIDKRNFFGETPLMRIAQKKKTDKIIKLLVEAGAQVNNADFSEKNTALMEAARKHNVSVVEILLEAKADVNAKNYQGATALHQLVDTPIQVGYDLTIGKAIPLINILVKAGADINAQDSDGDTPLIIAVKEKGHVDAEQVVKTLLEKGADPLIKNHEGQTAYDIVQYEPSKAILAKAMGLYGS